MAVQSARHRHHTLIQSLLSRGPMKEADFRSIFSQLTAKTSGSRRQQHQKLFNACLRKINSELSYVQLELRACRNQYDGEVYYGVVNNVSDAESKLGTNYTVPQIAYYKGIVEAILQEADGCIFTSVALNMKLKAQRDSQSQGGAVEILPAFKNFTMTQKDKTLNQLIKDQWLCSRPEGKIGIGVRSFLDLRSWFRWNGVPACKVCNEAAIKVQLCENDACNVRLHPYCLKKIFSDKRVDRVCPGCGMQLHGSMVIAGTVKKRNNANGSCQISQPHKTSRKRSRGSDREATAAIDNPGNSSSRSFAATSGRKRVTRSSARLNDN